MAAPLPALPEPTGRAQKRGTHDPARKRKGFSMRKPSKRVGKADSPLEIERSIFDGAALLGDCDVGTAVITKTLKQMAPLLWAADYKSYLDKENEELAEMGVMAGAAVAKLSAPPSSYAQRRLHRDKEKRGALELKQMRNVAAQSVRQANQQTFPFSVCARSVAMLMRRSTTFDWSEMLVQRAVVSKPTAHKLAKMMMMCKPSVSFKTMKGLFFGIFDQCYKKKGASRANHKAAERVDASGDLVDLVSIVIVNSMTMHVPDTLAGGISPALATKLMHKGPYSEPFAKVLPILEPDTVAGSLYDMLRETGKWVDWVGQRFGFDDPADHNVASIARALAGRPNLASELPANSLSACSRYVATLSLNASVWTNHACWSSK